MIGLFVEALRGAALGVAGALSAGAAVSSWTTSLEVDGAVSIMVGVSLSLCDCV